MYRLRTVSMFMIWLLIQTHSLRGYYVERSTERTSRVTGRLVTQLLSTCLNFISSETITKMEKDQVASLCSRVADDILKDLPLVEVNLLRGSKQANAYRSRVGNQREIESENGVVEKIGSMSDKKETLDQFYENSAPRAGKRESSSVASGIERFPSIKGYKMDNSPISNDMNLSMGGKKQVKKNDIMRSEIVDYFQRLWKIPSDAESIIRLPRVGKGEVKFPGKRLGIDIEMERKRLMAIAIESKRRLEMNKGGKLGLMGFPRGQRHEADEPMRGKHSINMKTGGKRVLIGMPKVGKFRIGFPKAEKRDFQLPRSGKREYKMDRNRLNNDSEFKSDHFKKDVFKPGKTKRHIYLPRSGR